MTAKRHVHRYIMTEEFLYNLWVIKYHVYRVLYVALKVPVNIHNTMLCFFPIFYCHWHLAFIFTLVICVWIVQTKNNVQDIPYGHEVIHDYWCACTIYIYIISALNWHLGHYVQMQIGSCNGTSTSVQTWYVPWPIPSFWPQSVP